MFELSERDICTKFITPAIVDAGWDIQTQIFEEKILTDGRIIVRGKLVMRSTTKRADYVLYLKPNIPIAVIEAKDAKHTVSDGMQQALTYAKMLNVPFAFSSNGKGFTFHDMTGRSQSLETNLEMGRFPPPAELEARYWDWKGLREKQTQIAKQGYFEGKVPRY